VTDRLPAAFTIDRGTASTSAALVAHLDGRARILAAAAQPAGAPVEPLLARLVEDVRSVSPELLERMEDWPALERLESATRPPPSILVLGPTESAVSALAWAAASTGWRVSGQHAAEASEVMAISGELLDPDLETLLIGAADPPTVGERGPLADLLAMVSAALARRPDRPEIVLAGGAVEAVERLPGASMIFAPAASSRPDVASHPLRDLLAGLAAARTDARDPAAVPDGRVALARVTASLAALLDRRVELVDVGASASTRILADPHGIIGQVVRVDAALAPREAINDDAVADRVLAWSTIRADPATLRDRVRNLVIAPWRDAAGDGARLRLAAGRAALVRLDDGWRLPASADGRAADYTADLLIVSGGAFAVAPAPAVSLALVDTLRRPGAMALAHDHARVLAPIGALADEEDRRRLLTDMLEDALAPLGSAILATGLRSGRHRGSLRLTTTDGASDQVELMAGGVQLLDLPPGLVATAELTTRDGAWLGVRSHRLAVDVAGGLGGLLVDTREIPLRLPDRPERRRDLLDAWQRPLWSGVEP
jgi:hypothetical protein